MFLNTKCLLVTSSINLDVWASNVIVSKYGSSSFSRPPASRTWWGTSPPACWYNFNSLLLLIIDWIAFATVSKSYYIKPCSSFRAVIFSRPPIYQAEIKPANVRSNKHRLIPLIQYHISSLDNFKSVSKNQSLNIFFLSKYMHHICLKFLCLPRTINAPLAIWGIFKNSKDIWERKKN